MNVTQRILSLCVPAVLCLLPGCTHPPAADEAGVHQWISDFTKAFEARDANAVIALYAPDVVAFDLVPPLEYTDRNAYAKDFAGYFAQFKGPLGLEYRDMHITVSGDLAVIEGLERMTGTMTNGQAVDIWMRDTTALRKVDGKWLDFHDHLSVPADLATGKAALDLKP